MFDFIILGTLLERGKSVATVGTEENLVLSAVTNIYIVSESLDTVPCSFHMQEMRLDVSRDLNNEVTN
jgi:hypothetical protein